MLSEKDSIRSWSKPHHIDLIERSTPAEQLDRAERKLRHYYKCPALKRSSPPCFYSGNSTNNFKQHLSSAHENLNRKKQLYCLYCNEPDSPNAGEMSATELVGHINEKHRYDKYQCNLCTFRTDSKENVEKHHGDKHAKIYEHLTRPVLPKNYPKCLVIEGWCMDDWDKNYHVDSSQDKSQIATKLTSKYQYKAIDKEATVIISFLLQVRN